MMATPDQEYDDGIEQYPAIQQQAKQITEAAEVGYVPPLPEAPADVLDLDNVMAYTQQVRLGAIKTINHALKQGVDSEMINALLKAAGDMDKATVNRRRVGIEEEAAKTSEQTQRDTAAILRSLAGKANAFRVDPNEVDPNRKAPSLPPTVELPTGVPGETEIGTPQLSYDGFAKENGFEAPQS
jgi:hypothetical protein